MSLLRDDIEYLVHCEENGVVIGPISKLHAHMQGPRQVLTHYSTRSMIYNPLSDQYGIQLKNEKKHDSFAGGKRDMGVAGHNSYIYNNGSYIYTNFTDNLVKEAEEEIGI